VLYERDRDRHVKFPLLEKSIIDSACDIVPGLTSTSPIPPPTRTTISTSTYVPTMPPSKHRLAVFLLRFLISKSEYERLECILSPYTPEPLRPHLPSTVDFDQRPRSPSKDVPVLETAIGSRDEYLPATVRQGTRVFAGTYVAATLVDVVLIGIIKKHRFPPPCPSLGLIESRQTITRNLANKRSLKTALATSVTISLYRTLLRVLSLPKFQVQHLSPGFLAGVLAGLAFAIHPADARRVTITIYFLTRTLEFCYNLLDDKGILPREKPWWFGSWLVFPLASAQLLHAFIFDRDCFPQVPLPHPNRSRF